MITSFRAGLIGAGLRRDPDAGRMLAHFHELVGPDDTLRQAPKVRNLVRKCDPVGREPAR